MHKTFLQLGSLFALLGVILGAFGAHGLERHLNADQIATFNTGVRYQFYHAFALLVVAILFAPMKQDQLLTYAGWLFTVGIVFFSGSIYLLACREMLGIANWKWLGPITPIGGTLFIIGWGLLLVAAFRLTNN
ncbi:MAG: DUF423 domain-containing protein [Bacteroidota bacterium]